MGLFKKVWGGIKSGVQWAIKGVGSILSPETKVEIKLDTMDWVTGQVDKTVEKVTGQTATQLAKEAALRDTKQQIMPFVWIGGAVLLVILLMRK